MHLINACRHDKGKLPKKYVERSLPNDNEKKKETTKGSKNKNRAKVK
jgi:hypothetical protein